MSDVKLKLISLTMAGVSLLSLTNCSSKKSSPYDGLTLINPSLNDEFVNVDETFLTDTIEKFIEKVKSSNIDIDWNWDFFYEALGRTVFKELDDNEFILGSYNRETNLFTYQEGDVETLNHELMHILLPYYDNSSLCEGINQIFLREIFGDYSTGDSIDEGMCKIFSRVLTKDELKEFLTGNYEVLPTKLSEIVPEYSDAEEFLRYLNDSYLYEFNMNQSIYNGTFDSYKQSNEYAELKDTRRCIVGRIKVYLSQYYKDINNLENPEERILEMMEVLNIINFDLCHPIIDEGIPKNDNFLDGTIDAICDKYNITTEQMQALSNKSSEKEQFKYLPRKGPEKLK